MANYIIRLKKYTIKYKRGANMFSSQQPNDILEVTKSIAILKAALIENLETQQSLLDSLKQLRHSLNAEKSSASNLIEDDLAKKRAALKKKVAILQRIKMTNTKLSLAEKMEKELVAEIAKEENNLVLPQVIDLLDYILARNKEFWKQKNFAKEAQDILNVIWRNEKLESKSNSINDVVKKSTPSTRTGLFSSSLAIDSDVADLLKAIQNQDIEKLQSIKRKVIQASDKPEKKRHSQTPEMTMMHNSL